MEELSFQRSNIDKVFKALGRGKVAVIPTDTLYGICGQALNKKTVKRIYRLRKRSPDKPCIILISSVSNLRTFGVYPNVTQKNILKKVWPGPVSVILPCRNTKFAYLHRGTYTLAFRLPANYGLRQAIKKTGPLVVPSANLEGQTPATKVDEAKKYFGKKVDYYLRAGTLKSKPSTLIELQGSKIKVLRKGLRFSKNGVRKSNILAKW